MADQEVAISRKQVRGEGGRQVGRDEHLNYGRKGREIRSCKEGAKRVQIG